MITLFLTLALNSGFAQKTIQQGQKPPACPSCLQLVKLKEQAEAEPDKAVDAFASFLKDVDFVQDKPKVRKQELRLVFEIAALVIDRDDGNIAAYLVNLQDDVSAEFKSVWNQMPEETQKALNEPMKLAREALSSPTEPEKKEEPHQ